MTKTPSKTTLVDLGREVYDEVSSIAKESQMTVSTVARLLIRHALKAKGYIGYIPQHTIYFDQSSTYPLQGSSKPPYVPGHSPNAG